MTKHTSRLIILSGFFLMTLYSILILLSYFLSYSLLSSPIINGVLILSWALVILGFGILFLAEHKILDLLIAVAFAASLIMRMAENMPLRFDPLQLLVSGRTQARLNVMIPAILMLIALWVWAFKLIKKKPVASVALIATTLIPYIASKIPIASLSMTSATLIWTLTYVIMCSLYTLAAYLDT